MPVTIEIKARNEAIRAERCASALRVLEAPEFVHLPDLKLLAFFDDEDAQCFKEACGPDNRGVFLDATVGTGGWPHYLTRLLSTQNPRPSPDYDDLVIYFFERLIYLHGSTCDDSTALVMTFAHELQHLVQFGYNRGLWAANTLLSNLSGIKISDIPTEREARIVAKRVAEDLCGTDVVHQYILRKIADRASIMDVDDWQCIERLESSTPYDLANETVLAFRRQVGMRNELERRLLERSSDPSFNDVDLSLYFQSTVK